ncbi:MAG: S8 family serine peptidase [Candidatus Melainabacteria bacterium]|nr:S8 family serine peptidase [Candidatus Melainabacteria bacterium]
MPGYLLQSGGLNVNPPVTVPVTNPVVSGETEVSEFIADEPTTPRPAWIEEGAPWSGAVRLPGLGAGPAMMDKHYQVFTIHPQTLEPETPIGQLNPSTGEVTFRYTTPQGEQTVTESIFNSYHSSLAPEILPETQQQNIARTQAATNYSALVARAEAVGLTGAGVPVWVIDENLPGIVDHANQVVSAFHQLTPANQPTVQLLASRDYHAMDVEASQSLEEGSASLTQVLASQRTAGLTDITTLLEQASRLPEDQRPEVINISLGAELSSMRDSLSRQLAIFRMSPNASAPDLASLKTLNPEGFGSASQLWLLNQEIYRGETDVPPEVLDQRMNDFIARIQQEPVFQQALARQQAALQQAEANGITVVMAAGNANMPYRDSNVSLPAGAQQNLWGGSTAIMVGAADTNGTLNPEDDAVANYSSLGAVTLITEGALVVSEPGLNPSDPPEATVVEGTSYAAPRVTALLTLHAQLYPEATPAQRREFLAQYSHDLTQFGPEADGQGSLNIPAAMEALIAEAERRKMAP